MNKFYKDEYEKKLLERAVRENAAAGYPYGRIFGGLPAILSEGLHKKMPSSLFGGQLGENPFAAPNRPRGLIDRFKALEEDDFTPYQPAQNRSAPNSLIEALKQGNYLNTPQSVDKSSNPIGPASNNRHADVNFDSLHTLGGLSANTLSQADTDALNPNAGTANSTKSQFDDMTAKGLVEYWLQGHGGAIVFGPNSNISREFAGTRGALQFENFVYEKFDGAPQPGDRVDDYAWKFNAERFAAEPRDSITHVIGSWHGGAAVTDNTEINFSVENIMSWNSFWGGRPLNDWFGVEPVGERPSDLHMTIKYRKPLRRVKDVY